MGQELLVRAPAEESKAQRAVKALAQLHQEDAHLGWIRNKAADQLQPFLMTSAVSGAVYRRSIRRKNACGFALMDSDVVTVPLVAAMGPPKLLQLVWVRLVVY